MRLNIMELRHEVLPSHPHPRQPRGANTWSPSTCASTVTRYIPLSDLAIHFAALLTVITFGFFIGVPVLCDLPRRWHYVTLVSLVITIHVLVALHVLASYIGG
jgi:hypothetical protein